MEKQKNNPLHGITLEQIMHYLVDNFGWDYLATQAKMNCFHHAPSIKSCLTFLRKTPWARTKIESLYVYLKRKHPEFG